MWRRRTRLKEFFMPITIGAKPAGDFSNPMELLSDCHRRIERFLGVLVTITRQAQDGLMTGQQKEEWLRALEYFRNAAPRHTADEEESLFPRLRQIEQPQIKDALVKMQELEEDHEQANEWHAEVDHLGRRWLADTTLTRQEAEHLAEVLAWLTELYGRHLALEDESVFPLAAAVLPQNEKARIGVEMAQRRGLDPKRTLERASELSGFPK
jgi:hemerythrin-like domain-containing protein